MSNSFYSSINISEKDKKRSVDEPIIANNWNRHTQKTTRCEIIKNAYSNQAGANK